MKEISKIKRRIKNLLDMSLFEIPNMVRDDYWNREAWLKRWSNEIVSFLQTLKKEEK